MKDEDAEVVSLDMERLNEFEAALDRNYEDRDAAVFRPLISILRSHSKKIVALSENGVAASSKPPQSKGLWPPFKYLLRTCVVLCVLFCIAAWLSAPFSIYYGIRMGWGFWYGFLTFCAAGAAAFVVQLVFGILAHICIEAMKE